MADTSTLPTSRYEAFETLHRQQLLGAHETVSGAGSTLMHTRTLRAGLAFFFKTGLVKTLLDIGCGDFNWMSAMDLHGVDYIGSDLLTSVIEQNQRLWQRPGVRFEVHDVVASPLARAYDLVLCKDVFSHFPQQDIVAAFNHIKQSGSRYIAISNYYPALIKDTYKDFYQKHTNSDAAAGLWRPVALCEKPFFFPAPLWSVPLNQPGKMLDIWELGDLPLLDEKKVASPDDFSQLRAVDMARLDFFQKLCALPFIKKISAYGSRARGDFKHDSDIDLLLYADPRPNRKQWLEVCDIINKADIPLEVDCKLYSPKVHTLLDMVDDVNNSLVVLYERKS